MVTHKRDGTIRVLHKELHNRQKRKINRPHPNNRLTFEISRRIVLIARLILNMRAMGS